MSAPYFYQLFGHVFLASHTADKNAEVAKALSGAGFGADRIKQGLEMSSSGEELLERKTVESPDNKTLEHNIHGAVMDVELWHQAARLRLRKSGLDAELVEAATGHEIHSIRHPVTAIAQGLRTIGVVRTLAPEQLDAIGSRQSVRDMITRGNTLNKKLYNVVDDFVSPSSVMGPEESIFEELESLMQHMSGWIDQLDMATQKMEGALPQLGLLGYLPHGMGLPVGGTAFSVVLHQRAIKEAPDPRAAIKTSGWAVGRQGNRENLGKGWVADGHGSVMND